MSVNFWQTLKMTKQTILCELFFLNVKIVIGFARHLYIL